MDERQPSEYDTEKCDAGDIVAFNGNFGICHASPTECWVTDGSWCPKINTGEHNLARVKRRKANALVKG